MNDEIKIGTKIRALKDSPDGGYVKKGEVGIIINYENEIASFPSQKAYHISLPLDKTKYEIVSTFEVGKVIKLNKKINYLIPKSI